MPKWTKEQQLAIDIEGTSVIVSAGAGSGKTAVLSERVVRKLKDGIDVDRLLILTFTNAAAREMKSRIRDKIIKNNLEEQLHKLDSSYITTFDSFALAITKKYHYLLNMDKDLDIANDLVLKFKLLEIIDKVFDDLYLKEDKNFLTLLKDFTIKGDEKIKDMILDIYQKLDLKYDKTNYLDNYLENFFNDNYIDLGIKEFEDRFLGILNEIKENLRNIELIADGDWYSKLYDSLKGLIESTDYDSIRNNLDINMPRIGRNMDDVKPYKEKIKNLIEKLKDTCIYSSSKEIKEDILKTKTYVEVIVRIIKEIDKEFMKYKLENNIYSFTDISKFAIKIVSDYEEVREELRDYFQEILIDEYQDTSDLQELFISKIANDNVYMVGDIKQSIYRFRNANPNLFKMKYDNYSKHLGGVKIDLLENFRSREETLANINYIFNFIMDLEIGGADYKNSHQMVFGNKTYNDYNPDNQDFNFELLNYELEGREFSNAEVEAFIVAKDIKDKMDSHYQVFDKDNVVLRDITYDDFVILIDKSTNFELYKKIFEYHGIPLTILKDESISGSNDLLVLKNILVLLKCLKEGKFDKTFCYSYLSIGRSYLFNISDNTLYQDIKNKHFEDSPILKPLDSILENLDETPLSLLIEEVIEKYNFYEKLLTVRDIEDSIIRLDYFKDLATNLESLGYTYFDFIDYLELIKDNEEEIKYSLNKEIKNSVKIMSIHKSKGLEYHICYYTGLTSEFNLRDAYKKFVYDNKYGIITPVFHDGIKPTIYNILYKESYIKEDISERIRLFYVALTRAKEKMILVTSLKDTPRSSDSELVDTDMRLKYRSFSGILNSISEELESYKKDINLNDYHLTKDYNIIKEVNIMESIEKTNDKIQVLELESNNQEVETSKFSKTNKTFVTKEDKEKLELGEMVHYLFEITDFLNPNLSKIPDKFKTYIENFLKLDLLKDISKARIYKEYEFIYQDNDIKRHGIIDLMLEYQDRIDIIDYKLKNIDDDAYINQLEGYRSYIETKSNKPVNLYLYSIIDNKYKTIV